MTSVPKHAWFSVKRPGLILWRMPRVLTNDDVALGTEALAAFFSKTRVASAWIVDLSDMEQISASQRKVFYDNEKRIALFTKIYVSRLAFVVPNTFTRAALTAYFWIWEPPYPCKRFATREPAEEWVMGRDESAHQTT